jgi:hypothetical protein
MSGNLFTNLIPSFFAGLNKVSQEQCDSIDAVQLNSQLEQAYLGQTITYPIAPVASLQDTVYSGLPTPTDSTSAIGTLSLTDSSSYVFAYTGDEQRQLQLGGIYSNYYADQVAQGARALRKAVATTIVNKVKVNACRAIGTAGATPFGSAGDMSDFGQCNKLLNDNGSPDSDRHLILNTASVANVQGKLSNLYKANEAGTDRLLRTGSIGTVEGMSVGLETQLSTISTFGTGLTDTSANGQIAIGDTSFAIYTAAGTPVAGDTFYFGSDTSNVYVVKSWTNGSKTITIPAPGIRATVTTTTTLHWNTTAWKPNFFFTRDAVQLIARQPLLAYTGGAQGQLLDLTTLPDPRSGLIYQMSAWQNGRQIVMEMALCWGVGVVNPQNLGLLLG